MHLQTSTSSLREAIARAKAQPKRVYAETQAAEQALALLSGTVLQQRDAAVKAELKQVKNRS